MIDRDRLEAGLFVAWTPRANIEIEDLEYGHPGVVGLPDWQDVGVTWSGLERAAVAASAVYSIEDLPAIGVEEFCRRTLSVLARLSEESSSESDG